MKTLKLIALGIFLTMSHFANSQIIVNATIAMEPIWNIIPIEGPRYEYYPDQEMYYDRQTYMYVYYNGSTWGRSVYIPQPFINIDFGSSRKVRIDDYRGRTPYVFIDNHRRLYGKGENGFHGGNEHGEQGHDNGFRGNENHGRDNGNHGNENVNHGNENHNQGGNEHREEGGHGKRK